MTLPLLDTPPATRPPARPLVPGLRLVPAVDQPSLPLAPAAPAPTANEVPAPLVRAARAVTLVVVEVLAGRRPVGQLGAVAEPAVARAVGRLTRARWGRDLRLRSMRVQHPTVGALEVAFHVGDATRSRAGAMRLQLGPSGWRCVLLDVGPG